MLTIKIAPDRSIQNKFDNKAIDIPTLFIFDNQILYSRPNFLMILGKIAN